jgi:hypothetical protein
MASGGGGSSSSSGSSIPTTLSPIPILFGELFGLNGRATKNGGLTFTRKQSNIDLANPLVNPDTFNSLAELFKPVTPFNLDIAGTANSFGQQMQDLFGGTVMPAARELASTGFKTDIAPAVALSKNLFENEFLPSAAEQFGSLGLNPRDSDFGAALAREAGRRSTELGALDVQLSEAAAGRRAADSLFGLEQSSRQAARAQSPGGQLFDLLNQIAGINTQGQTASTQSSSSAQGQGGILK